MKNVIRRMFQQHSVLAGPVGTNALSFSERTGGKLKIFGILHPRKDQTSFVPPRH